MVLGAGAPPRRDGAGDGILGAMPKRSAGMSCASHGPLDLVRWVPPSSAAAPDAAKLVGAPPARHLAEHNDPTHNAGKHTTRSKDPWSLVHDESFATRTEVMQSQKWLKSGIGRE